LPFDIAILAIGTFQLGFDIDRLRTLTLVTLLFNGQAVFYVVRERRRLWSSWPSPIVIASSMADLAIIPTMAIKGILMAPLPIPVVLGLFAAAVVLALVLDQVKVATFGWLRMV
jgi:H+-transporting ATPase